MGKQRNENIICFWGSCAAISEDAKIKHINLSIWKRVNITYTKIKLMPPERKNKKIPSIRYLNLNIFCLSLDVVVYTCCKYNADRRVIHPTSVRRNMKLKDAVRVARCVDFYIVFCRVDHCLSFLFSPL